MKDDLERFRNINKIIDEGQEPKTRFAEFDYLLSTRSFEALNLEFGVWKGQSINYMASRRPSEWFYGFDSFEGLPEDWNHGTKPRKAGFFATDIPQVASNVILTKGWYEDTLGKFLETHGGPISLLHMDSDIYSSTKFVLNRIVDRIVPGTIIRFDDFIDWRAAGIQEDNGYLPRMFYTKWREGEFKAWNEFVIDNNIKYDILYRSWNKSIGIRVISEGAKWKSTTNL